MKYTIEDIKNEISKINSKAIVLTTTYVNNRQPLEIVCSDCGEIFYKTWDTIKQKRTCKCKSCTRKDGWKNKRHEDGYVEDYKEIFLNHNLIPLEPILNKKDKILCLDRDGFKGYISCYNVSLNKHFSIFSLVFNEEYFLYNLNNYMCINGYNSEVISYQKIRKTCDSILTIKCVCGEIFTTTVSNLFGSQQYRCKKCSKSISVLENKMIQLLKLHNISFKFQYRFKDCVSSITNYSLPFDFYLPDYNICIEVDGAQHYKPIDFGGGYAKSLHYFYKQCLHDEIKNEYCKKHNIKLIRIPYTDISGKHIEYQSIITQIKQ